MHSRTSEGGCPLNPLLRNASGGPRERQRPKLECGVRRCCLFFELLSQSSGHAHLEFATLCLSVCMFLILVVFLVLILCNHGFPHREPFLIDHRLCNNFNLFPEGTFHLSRSLCSSLVSMSFAFSIFMSLAIAPNVLRIHEPQKEVVR